MAGTSTTHLCDRVQSITVYLHQLEIELCDTTAAADRACEYMRSIKDKIQEIESLKNLALEKSSELFCAIEPILVSNESLAHALTNKILSTLSLSSHCADSPDTKLPHLNQGQLTTEQKF